MYGDRPQVNWFQALIHDPLAMGFLFLLSLAPTALLGWGVWVGLQIESEGVPATAELTWAGLDGDPARHVNTSYYVEYDFSPPGSDLRYGPYWVHGMLRATVPDEVYAEVRHTRSVPVLYVPQQPQWNLPQECRTTERLALFAGICTCLNIGVLGCVFLAFYLRRARSPLGMLSSVAGQSPYMTGNAT